MESKNIDFQLEVIYRLPLDSIPVLVKDFNKEENKIEYSRIEIVNPELSFPKTYLELYGNFKQLIGRYASENGTKDNCFFPLANSKAKMNFPFSKTIDLVLTQKGNLWRLTSEYISYSKTGDSSEIHFPLSGMKIIESSDDAIWVVGLENTWFLNNDLKDVKTFPWQGGNNSVGAGERLCFLNNSKDKIIFLNKQGEVSTREVKNIQNPFENLVGLWENNYMTLAGTTFRIYDSNGLRYEIPLQSVGVLNNGEPFISYTKEKTTYLKSSSHYRNWKLPSNYSNYILPIIGEKDGTYIGYHIGFLGEFNEKDSMLKSLATINDTQYKERVYPYRWKTGQSRFYSISDDKEIIVSITGPKEVILVRIVINS